LHSLRRKLVIDTNVLISASIAKAGQAAHFLDHAVRHEQVIFCEASYFELMSRLAKPKFDRYFDVNQREGILQSLHAVALWQTHPTPFPGAVRCRDPKDNLFIDLALHSNASMLITGDQDLLVLADALAAHGLQVLPPAQALALLQAE
jgi:uncharacterized protein